MLAFAIVTPVVAAYSAVAYGAVLALNRLLGRRSLAHHSRELRRVRLRCISWSLPRCGHASVCARWTVLSHGHRALGRPEAVIDRGSTGVASRHGESERVRPCSGRFCRFRPECGEERPPALVLSFSVRRETHGDNRRRCRAGVEFRRLVVYLEPSRADELRGELDGIVRTMFVLYSLLIVGGVVFFITVGLTQQ